MRVKTDSGVPQGELDHSNISGRAPTFREKCLPAGIIAEEVEGFVDSLLLYDNILPTREVFADLRKFSVSAGTRVVQCDSYIFNAARYFTKRTGTILGVGIDGVQRGPHALCDLADFSQEGVSVGEDDENVLPGLHSCHGIDERLDYIGVVHIQVPAQYTP